MSDSGHPSRHGFVQCVLCGTWRRINGNVCWAMPSTPGAESQGPMCSDWSWCKDAIRAKSPETARPATFGTKPGWDANGSPIDTDGATTPKAAAPAPKDGA